MFLHLKKRITNFCLRDDSHGCNEAGVLLTSRFGTVSRPALGFKWIFPCDDTWWSSTHRVQLVLASEPLLRRRNRSKLFSCPNDSEARQGDFRASDLSWFPSTRLIQCVRVSERWTHRPIKCRRRAGSIDFSCPNDPEAPQQIST